MNIKPKTSAVNGYTISAMSLTDPDYYPCPRGPAGPPGPPGPRGFPGSLNNTAISFAYAQLAHVIEQLIEFYPNNNLFVYISGFSPSSVSGKPYQLYTSSDGSFGGLFILNDNGLYEAIPLNAIVAMQFDSTGGTVAYNPAITYLSKPNFPPGYDTNIVTSIHDYIATLTGNVQFYMGSLVNSIGPIYQNPYGLIVMAENTGNNPAFIPVLNITVFYPVATAKLDEKSEKSLAVPSGVTVSTESNKQ